MAVSDMKPYRYLVTYNNGSNITVDEVDACYLQEDSSLVLLKGPTHEIVYAVRTHCLVSVVRGEPVT